MKPTVIRFARRLAMPLLAGALLGFRAAAQAPVVRAVLFFSPTCPHCHKVIQEDLPRIFAAYGGEARVFYDQSVPAGQITFYDVTNGQLEILLVDVTHPEGAQLYKTNTAEFRLPEDRLGVPRLVIGDTVLVGSLEIPTHLPRYIEAGMNGSALDWPAITGLRTALAAVPGRPFAAAETEPAPRTKAAAPKKAPAEAARPEAGAAEPEPAPLTETAAPKTVPAEAAQPQPAAVEPEPATTEPEAEADTAAAREPESLREGGAAAEGAQPSLAVIPERKATMIENYRRDPLGNSISVVVLIGMVVSLLSVGYLWRLPARERRPGWTIPLISLFGIGIAAYLAYIETSGATAVCGPVGDCNTVNQSEYASLFGLIPVGVVGLLGYVAVIAVWLVSRLAAGSGADWARIVLLALTALGTLFSVYLTFLEPFVIGATCAWCLTSAVVMTILMWLSVGPAAAAWTRLRGPPSRVVVA